MSAKNKSGLVAKICNNTELATAISQVESQTLLKIVDKVGLEDASSLVSLFSKQQLTEILDQDLWRLLPGKGERFRSDRFALWLYVLAELGEKEFYLRLREMDEEFLCLGLADQVMVVDQNELNRLVDQAQQYGFSEKRLEQALDSMESFEVDRYWIFSRTNEHWDTLTAVFATLVDEDSSLLSRVLSRLAEFARPALDDLECFCDVLDEYQSFQDQMTADREDRRAMHGFISPQRAQAFLRLAKEMGITQLCQETKEDPITQEYFRDLQQKKTEESAAPFVPQALLDLLYEYSVIEPAGAPRLQRPRAGEKSFDEALRAVSQQDKNFERRAKQEMTFLGNIVLSGLENFGEPYRPREALDKMHELCEMGLCEIIGVAALDEATPGQIESTMMQTSFVKLFKIGYCLSTSEAS